MKIFVVNCGSSSIKYQLISITHERVMAKGVLERVGTNEAQLTHSAFDEKHERAVDAPDHSAGMRLILDALADDDIGVIGSIDEIQAIGHRVVHGGERFSKSCLVDDEVIQAIRDNFLLSPLHNPPNLAGIEAARKALPDKPNVAVFDTAFLSTLPAKAFRYAVPEQWYKEHKVRRYGFHGTSHLYVSRRFAEIAGKSPEQVNLITAHLGNGCSMTAIANGRAVDHTMGMTPLEGLIMGTRCGDIDPAVVTYMVSQGMDITDVDRALNKASGLLGVSQTSNDMRDLLTARDEGNEGAALAVEMFIYRIVKYVGSYYTVLPNLDAVVLTGGIGENSQPVRAGVVQGLARLGAKLDPNANEKTIRGKTGPITTEDSDLPVWIVPTNEELMIARDTAEVVEFVPAE